MKNFRYNIFRCLIWLIWIASILSLIIYRAILGDAQDAMNVDYRIFVLLSLLGFLCLFFRWVLMPKLDNLYLILCVFILGILSGEIVIIYGYYVYPKYSDHIFIISLFLIGQYIPLFLKSTPEEKAHQMTSRLES